MTPIELIEAAERDLDVRGWSVVAVDLGHQRPLRETIRDVMWAKGWRVRTNYRPDTQTLSVVRSTPRDSSAGTGRTRDTPDAV